MITVLWSKMTHNWWIKCFFAGIVALGILSLFSVFYYNPPIHVACETGATDYTREANSFWARGTEGFASGTTDANGYNNVSVKDEKEQIDILLMGSSQTEGLYVKEKDALGYRLNEILEEAGEKKQVYNIGMSSHSFLRNVSNIENALKTYQPSEYVILETNQLDFSVEEMTQAMQDQMPQLTDYGEGFLYKVQKIPYIKLLYHQYKNYQENQKDTQRTGEILQTGGSLGNAEKVREMLGYLKYQAQQYQTDVMIFYYPDLALQEDGTLVTSSNEEKTKEFQKLCEENEIIFVDVTEAFEEEYKINHRIVSGFPNTAECYGHLNRYGHELIAEAIGEKILEGQKR